MSQFKRKVYWLLGLCLLLVTLSLAREALVVVFIAFIFASALLPLVEKLNTRLPRWLSVLIPYALMFLVVLCLVLPILVLGLQQLQLFIADFPRYLDEILKWTSQWDFADQRYPLFARLNPHITAENISQFFSWQNTLVFSGFTGFTLAISQIGIDLLSSLVISIFLVMDWRKIHQYFLRFHPTRDHERLEELIEHLIRSTGAFVSGQILFMISFGTLIAVGLFMIGLPFPILLGTFAGILTLIPILGPNIAMIPTLIIALLTPGGWISAVWVFVLFIGVQIIENNIIGPWIMGRAVGLHPLAIIVSIMVGGMLFGLPGIVLAIPVAACFNIILEEWFMEPEFRRRNRLILPTEPIEPQN